MTYAGKFRQTYRPILSPIVNLSVHLRWLKAATRGHWLVFTINNKNRVFNNISAENKDKQEAVLLSRNRIQN